MVYLIAALMMLMLMLFLRKLIPLCKPISDMKYTQLLKSLTPLIKTEPLLLKISLVGALVFAAFSAFWTALIFLLDLGVHSCNVCNQTIIHSLNPETRNRLNTIYMVSFFLGGALGSFLALFCTPTGVGMAFVFLDL
jgi:hypothetical protein